MRTLFAMSIVFAFGLLQRQSEAMAPNLRVRRRAETLDEIKQAALDQIAAYGAGTLTVRGVARAIGMSPAGLYRYYDGLDSLITDLVADAYSDLASAVEAATEAPGEVLPRLREGMLAYRRWSLDHPNRFLLIFGTPIPGYSAPQDGPTVQAHRRVGAAFFSVVAEGWRCGRLSLPEATRATTTHERAFVDDVDPGFPPTWLSAFFGAWAHFHGMVTLEVLHQLDWVYPDAEIFFCTEIDRLLASWARTGAAAA